MAPARAVKSEDSLYSDTTVIHVILIQIQDRKGGSGCRGVFTYFQKKKTASPLKIVTLI